MTRHVILIGFFLIINQTAIYCQQQGYIRGKVIDSKTSEPVPYATVHLKNARLGSIPNAEGDFRILNDPAFQSDSLIVSCIGFHRLAMAFSALKKPEMGYSILNIPETNILKLVPNIYALKEVSVTARKRKFISPDIMIARALRNIKKNNPVEPFSYVSYYRDYQKDSINYLNLNEAIIQTLDKGFACTSDSNRYRLIEFRKNMDFSRKFVTPIMIFLKPIIQIYGLKEYPMQLLVISTAMSFLYCWFTMQSEISIKDHFHLLKH